MARVSGGAYRDPIIGQPVSAAAAAITSTTPREPRIIQRKELFPKKVSDLLLVFLDYLAFHRQTKDQSSPDPNNKYKIPYEMENVKVLFQKIDNNSLYHIMNFIEVKYKVSFLFKNLIYLVPIGMDEDDCNMIGLDNNEERSCAILLNTFSEEYEQESIRNLYEYLSGRQPEPAAADAEEDAEEEAAAAAGPAAAAAAAGPAAASSSALAAAAAPAAAAPAAGAAAADADPEGEGEGTDATGEAATGEETPVPGADPAAADAAEDEDADTEGEGEGTDAPAADAAADADTAITGAATATAGAGTRTGADAAASDGEAAADADTAITGAATAAAPATRTGKSTEAAKDPKLLDVAKSLIPGLSSSEVFAAANKFKKLGVINKDRSIQGRIQIKTNLNKRYDDFKKNSSLSRVVSDDVSGSIDRLKEVDSIMKQWENITEQYTNDYINIFKNKRKQTPTMETINQLNDKVFEILKKIKEYTQSNRVGVGAVKLIILINELTKKITGKDNNLSLGEVISEKVFGIVQDFINKLEHYDNTGEELKKVGSIAYRRQTRRKYQRKSSTKHRQSKKHRKSTQSRRRSSS